MEVVPFALLKTYYVAVRSLRDEKLAPKPELGDELARRVIALKEAGVPIEAFGFNCAPPEDIRDVFKVRRRLLGENQTEKNAFLKITVCCK